MAAVAVPLSLLLAVLGVQQILGARENCALVQGTQLEVRLARLERLDENVLQVDARRREYAPGERIEYVGLVFPEDRGMAGITQILAGQQRRVLESGLKVHCLGGELHAFRGLLAVLPMQPNRQGANLAAMQRALVMTGDTHRDLVVQPAEGFAFPRHQIEYRRRILWLDQTTRLLCHIVLLAVEAHAHAQTAGLVAATALGILEALRERRRKWIS